MVSLDSARFFILLNLLVFVLSIKAAAQTPANRVNDHNQNVWLSYSGDHKLATRWSIHTDLQFRRADLMKNPLQFLTRNGLNYHLTDNAMLTAGYAYAKTHPYGGYPAAAVSHENRLYQQLHLRNNLSRFELTHRFRQEQRWVKPEGQPTATYTNRSRYMFRATLPLIKVDNPTGSYPYLSASNELFINFGHNVQQNIFDQNRLTFMLGYRFSKAAAAEAGYMNQIVQKSNGVVFERNHVVQAGFTYHLVFTKKTTAE